MSELDFEAVNWAGVEHQVADSLSRRSTTGMDESPLEDDVTVLRITEVHPEVEKTD